MRVDTPALASILGSVEEAVFFRDYWTKRPLLLQGGDATNFDGLFGLDDLEHYLFIARPAAGDVQRLLTQWKTRYSAFRNLAVVATDGRILASTDSERLRADPTPVDGSPDAPTAVLPGSTDSTGAQLDGQLDSGIVVFAPWSAVYMRAGHLLAELDLEDLRRIARDYTGMGQTGETLLARRDSEASAGSGK